MIFSIETFKEKGLNLDLTGNDFDIVLFQKYHFGIYNGAKKNKLISIYLQNSSKTYMLGLWLSNLRAKSYFKGWNDSDTYKKKLWTI